MRISNKKRIESLTTKVLQNADKMIFYQEYKFYIFCELKSIIDENIVCLILDLNQASICLTNHLLERSIKRALISFYLQNTKFGEPDFVRLQQEAYSKFDNLVLEKSVDFACKEKILTNDEGSLVKCWKNTYRNPFSHANISKILPENASDIYFPGWGFDFRDSTTATKESPMPMIKVEIPMLLLAQTLQSDLAKDKAFEYFDNVFKLMIKIDKRYKEKFNIKFPIKMQAENP